MGARCSCGPLRAELIWLFSLQNGQYCKPLRCKEDWTGFRLFEADKDGCALYVSPGQLVLHLHAAPEPKSAGPRSAHDPAPAGAGRTENGQDCSTAAG